MANFRRPDGGYYLLTLIGVIWLIIGIVINIQLFWVAYPEKTTRQIWIEHYEPLIIATSLIFVGILCLKAGMEKT